MIYVFNKKIIILSLSLFIIFISTICIYNSVLSSTVTKVVSNTVIIDPGHGGEDGGAVGITGTKEKDLNLKIALNLKEKLLNSGFNVVLTRENDIMLCDENQKKNKKRTDLKNRVNITEKYSDGILISIHMNFFDDKTQKGAQVFYSANNNDSKIIAEKLQQEFINTLDKNNKRKIKPSGSEIFLLSRTKIPACLIECGFISNPTEEQLLLKENYQNKITDAITNAIINYYSI